jgi:hypothetical protein
MTDFRSPRDLREVAAVTGGFSAAYPALTGRFGDELGAGTERIRPTYTRPNTAQIGKVLY